MAYLHVSSERAFSLALLYLGILGLFHLPLVPLYWLGAEAKFQTQWLESPALGRALLLVTIASGSTVVGAAACLATRWGPGNLPAPMREPDRQLTNVTLWQAGIALWCIAGGMIAYGAYELGVLSAGYTDYWSRMGVSDTRFFGTGMMFLQFAAIMTVTASSPRLVPLLFAAYAASFAPLVLVGFRGQAVVGLIALLPAYHAQRPVFARRIALIGLLLVVFASPIIRIARIRADHDIHDLLKEASPIAFFAETGASLGTLVYTVGLIDSGNTTWWLGKSYTTAAARVLPNLQPDVRGGDAFAMGAPALWLTATIEPWLYARGQGLGYSGVAEPYLNFGAPGVAVFFLAVGFLLRRAEPLLGRRPFLTACILCGFASLLWTIRNDFTTFVRPAVWSCLMVAAAHVVDRQYRRWSHRRLSE